MATTREDRRIAWNSYSRRFGRISFLTLLILILYLSSSHAASLSLTGETWYAKWDPTGTDSGDVPTNQQATYSITPSLLYGGSFSLGVGAYDFSMAYLVPMRYWGQANQVGEVGVVLDHIMQLGMVSKSSDSIFTVNFMVGHFKGTAEAGIYQRAPKNYVGLLPAGVGSYVTKKMPVDTDWFQGEVLWLNLFPEGVDGQIGTGFGVRFNMKKFPMQVLYFGNSYSDRGLRAAYFENVGVDSYMAEFSYRLLTGHTGWRYGFTECTLGAGYVVLNSLTAGKIGGLGYVADGTLGAVYTTSRLSVEMGVRASWYSGATPKDPATNSDLNNVKYLVDFVELYYGPTVKATLHF